MCRGPTALDVSAWHTSTGAGGKSSTTAGGRQVAAHPGIEVACGDVGLDGDFGAMVHTADLDGDGEQSFSGIDVGIGPSLSVTASDADKDGNTAANVAVSAGPVNASTSSESRGSFLDSVGGWAKDRWSDARSTGSAIGKWLGFGK